jgi:ferredoxin-type protein NapG
MGTARIDSEICWAFNRILCRSCWHACPWPDRALRLNERLQPAVDSDVCIGCGLCVHACPTEPGSVTILPPQPATPTPRSLESSP